MITNTYVSKAAFIFVNMSVLLSLSLFSGYASGALANKKAQVARQKIPVLAVQPKIQLKEKTVKAVTKPAALSRARVPGKTIKPRNVTTPVTASRPVGVARVAKVQTTKRITGGRKAEKLSFARTSRPDSVRNLSRNVTPGMGLARMSALNEQRLREIGEIQRNIMEQARVARELEALQNGIATIPEVQAIDPAADTALEGRGIAMGESADANKKVYKMFFGRMTGEDTQDILNNGGIRAPSDQDRPGSFNRQPSLGGAVRDPGLTSWDPNDSGADKSDRTNTGDPVQAILGLAQTVAEAGGKTVLGFTLSVAAFWESMRGTAGSSESNVKEIMVNRRDALRDRNNSLDTDGDGIRDSSVDGVDTDGDGTADSSPPPPPADSQPNENASGKPDDCNWNPEWSRCMNRPRTTAMEAATQPVEGEDSTDTGSATPIVGPAAVTNPDEFYSGGGSERRRSAKDNLTDPIIGGL